MHDPGMVDSQIFPNRGIARRSPAPLQFMRIAMCEQLGEEGVSDQMGNLSTRLGIVAAAAAMMILPACALQAGEGDHAAHSTAQVAPAAAAPATPAPVAPAAPTPAPVAASVAPAAASDEVRFAKSRELFNSWSCSACHALADAKASGAVGPALDGNSSLTEAFIISRLTNGQGAMPAFGGQLTTEEIADMAYYLTKVAKK